MKRGMWKRNWWWMKWSEGGGAVEERRQVRFSKEMHAVGVSGAGWEKEGDTLGGAWSDSSAKTTRVS